MIICLNVVFQLLNSLHIVAEYSLPSLLKTLFKWYEKQVKMRIFLRYIFIHFDCMLF